MYGKRTARRAVLGLAALVSLVTACASGSAAAGGRGGLTVRVTNDLVPPASITVWITNELGSRRRLGTVAPDAQQEFAYSPISQSMEHRLIAEAMDGREVTSDAFVPAGIAAVMWSPRSPVVRLESSRQSQ